MARKDQIPVGFDEETSKIIRTLSQKTGDSLSVTICKIVREHIEKTGLRKMLSKEN